MEGEAGQEADAVLVKRYKMGDVDALDTLVRRHRRRLYGYILNMKSGADDPDEIFQEVWFRAIRKIHSYRERNFAAWLTRIARNLTIDRWRARKNEVSIDEENPDGGCLLDVIADRGMSPDAHAEGAELGRRIALAVNKLPAEQKEVVLLRVRAELPFREIAGIQGVSINTALARMQYALDKLRVLLGGEQAMRGA